MARLLVFSESLSTSAGEIPLLFHGGKAERETEAFLA
jgi:hypothetical protein